MLIDITNDILYCYYFDLKFTLISPYSFCYGLFFSYIFSFIFFQVNMKHIFIIFQCSI